MDIGKLVKNQEYYLIEVPSTESLWVLGSSHLAHSLPYIRTIKYYDLEDHNTGTAIFFGKHLFYDDTGEPIWMSPNQVIEKVFEIREKAERALAKYCKKVISTAKTEINGWRDVIGIYEYLANDLEKEIETEKETK